jgi:hypothetical protein
MGLNIIIRDKRSKKERTYEERGKAMLRHFYERECRNELGDFQKVTKGDVLEAWSDDAKGDIDPELLK